MQKKPLIRIQHNSIIKVLRKLGIERTYLNTVKAVYDKPISNTILHLGKTNSISPKIRN
jgi:hypothetical protein